MKYFTFIFIVVCSSNLYTQSAIPYKSGLESWLQSVHSETTIFTKEKFKNPAIRSYELRTETNDFDLDKQEFLFRLSPESPKKRKAQLDLFEHYHNKQQILNKELINEQIEEIYEDLISLYSLDKNLEYLEELDSIFIDQEKVITKMLTYGKIEYDQFLSLQSKKSNLKLDKFRNIEKRKFIEQKYENNAFDWTGFITVDEILIFLDNTSRVLTTQEFEYKKEGIEKQIALEKAEAKQLFDFGQLRYRGPTSNLLEERIQIGLGLQLNTSGTRNLKIQRLKMEMEELEWENKLQENKNLEEVKELQLKLKRDIAYYNTFIEFKKEEVNSANDILEVISKHEGIDPIKLLKNLEQEIKIQKEQHDIFTDILESYVDFLKLSGKMFEQPLTGLL